MNKSELIDEIAAECDITKAGAGKMVDAFMKSVTSALQRGESVTLVGFGTFSVLDRSARVGRNPKTGESIKIAAKKSPKFAAGKGLKDLIQSI
jgi:DNA-binding protein HU-beta